MPRWVAVLLPLTWPFELLLSQLGGALVAGAFFVFLGVVLTGGRLARPHPVGSD